MPIQTRLSSIRRSLKKRKADAFLLTNPLNVTYLTGFTGEDSCLLLTRDESILITDGRFSEQAAAEAPFLHVVLRKGPIFKTVSAALSRLHVRKLLIEESHLTHSAFLNLRKNRRLLPLPSGGIVDDLRAAKDPGELLAIRKAISIAEAAFRAVRPKIKPGVRESEIAARLAFELRLRGAHKESFDIIAVSGPRSSQPHARTSTRKLRIGDVLLLDWGATYRRYCSDLTRTFFIGNIAAEGRAIYQIVLAAQTKAIKEVRPGRRAKRIDGAAREIIRKAGFGENFMHGLGHGIGLAVHELPSLNPSSNSPLRMNSVFTIEPGIYIPGWGGIRIEDIVLVTKRGRKVLSSLPNSLSYALIPARGG